MIETAERVRRDGLQWPKSIYGLTIMATIFFDARLKDTAEFSELTRKDRTRASNTESSLLVWGI